MSFNFDFRKLYGSIFEILNFNDMKKSLLNYKSLFILLLILSSSLVEGQVLYEGFDYTIPGYIGGNGNAGSSSNNWTTHSVTSGQTTTLDLYSGSLSYTGMQASTGNKVLIFGNANATSRDVNRALTTSSTVIYFSALINIVDNSGISATGDYFMHVAQTSGTSVTVFGGRLGAKSVNSGANYRFMIQNTSGGTPTFTEYAEDMVFGTTYLVVVKFDRSTNPTTATLWINPATLGGSEPGGSVSNSSGTGTFSTFASVCLRNNATTPKAEIDEIYVGETFASVTPGVDITAPIAVFSPANSSTNVPVNVIPTITFNESILKTDGSVVTDGDLTSLIFLKETDASGATVAFSATIDANKKVITITPSANLKNAQSYYLAVSPVEDAAGNESTLKNVTFTTISATTPTITVVYPNGGEVMYSGDKATVTWTTTNFDAGENVKMDVWLPESVWYTLEASTPNDGSQVVNVGPRADYGTVYKIRISGVTNGAVDESDNPFTVIATTTTLDSLKTFYDLGSRIKYKGEAIITFIRTANRNQKYLQDATAGLLIDDASGVLTTTLASGDKITGLEGTLGTFTGMYQLVPAVATVTIVSAGNSVSVPTLTIPEYLANQTQYESMLIRIANLTFPAADGSATFAQSTQYTVTDGTNNLAFFTFKTGEGNPPIVGTIIPGGTYAITGLALKYNTTIEISSRSTNDFEFLSGIENASARDQIKLYPVPATSVLNVSGIQNLRSIEILDLAGKVIRTINTSTDEVIRIPVSNLRQGTYMLRLNTTEGAVIKKFVR